MGERGGSFGFRLFLGVTLTLLAAGLGSHLLVGGQIRGALVEGDERWLRADIAHLAEAPGSPRAAARRLGRRLLDERRFGSVIIADSHGHTVFTAGPPLSPGSSEVIVEPLHVRDHRFTLTAQHDPDRVAPILDAIGERLILFGIPALLLSLGLFWLLAGRVLQARHQHALDAAERDGLTGLGNHRTFQDELRRATALAERAGVEVALAVFDVDDFKFLNDRRGHVHGDEILRRVAEALRSGRRQDRAFRTGGDEFALLMPGTSEYEGQRAGARVRQILAESGVKISCGVSATRPDMFSASVLREEAEMALQEGKRRRATIPIRFSDVAAHSAVLAPETVQAVRMLISEGALDVALQPIWDLETGQMIGCEGLARPHGDYGLSGPAEAFDVAEQIGRIGDLDRLCVRRILRRGDQLPAGVRLFVNVHPASLDDGDEGRWLLDAVHQAGVSPRQVVVEVTERTGARIGSLVRCVERLRGYGLLVALDDVGAGNSGLEMLHRVKVDFVKVDKDVVRRAATDASARGVLAAIAAFAHETRTYVIAEGIEDEAGLEFVRSLEISAPSCIRGGQGHGLGLPVPTVAEAARGGVVRLAPSPAGAVVVSS